MGAAGPLSSPAGLPSGKPEVGWGGGVPPFLGCLCWAWGSPCEAPPSPHPPALALLAHDSRQPDHVESVTVGPTARRLVRVSANCLGH